MKKYRLLAPVLGVSLLAIALALSGCFLFKPAAPSNLTATTLSASSIELSWSGNGDSFIIYRSVSNSKSFKEMKEVKSTSYLDTGLSANTVYFYEVKSKNKMGISAPSNIASAKTLPLPPNAPDLKITSTSTDTITLSWTESSTNVMGYKLYWSTDSTTFTQIATIVGKTIYTDENLNPNTKYYYKMKAYNKGGDSKYSNVVNGKTEPVITIPVAPSDLKVASVTSGSVTLEWKSNSTNQEGFYVYRSTSPSGTYVKIADTTSTKYTDKDLNYNTTYYYEVTAYNSAGESSPSNIASGTTKQVIPFNPSELKITSVSTNTISMTWKDNSDNEEGFNIYRATDGTHFTKVASVTQNATQYTNENLKSDTIYYYKVSAYNSAGESTTSNIASTKTGIWIPTAPVDVEITSYSTDSITLKWKPTYEATVVIYRKSVSNNTYSVYTENGIMKAKLTSSSPSDFTPIATLSYTTNTYTDKGLEYNTIYYYEMRSYTKYGWSPFTSMASITTKDVLPKAPSDLKASMSGENSITLTWKDNSNNEEGFRIWRRNEPNQAYILIATVKANTTKYVDNSVNADKQYWYMVSAYNSVGNSWSKSVSIEANLSVIDTIFGWGPGNDGARFKPFDICVNPNTSMIYVTNVFNGNIRIIDGNTGKMLSTTISVGSSPIAISVNASTNKIYVANWGSNSVSVIDGNTDTVSTTISVGNEPVGIGVDPKTNTIYVANEGSNSVSVIDGNTDTVSTTISVGAHPSGIGVNLNTDKIYVANEGSANVSVISATTNTVNATISGVGAYPVKVGVNPNTNEIYVSNITDNTVSVIDGDSNVVNKTISVGSKPFGISVNPFTNKIYVTNWGGKTVNVIDGNTDTAEPAISVGSSPTGICVNSNTNKIYVANFGNYTISVIDGNTNESEMLIVGIGPVNVGANPTTNKIYVTNWGSNNVSVIDGNTDNVIDTIPVETNPEGICVNPVADEIYVANYWSDTMSVIDGDTDTVSTTISVGSGPRGIAVNTNTGKIYVVNEYDDNVSVIDKNTYEIIGTIPVGSDPWGIAVNSKTNKIYVANGESNSVSVINGKTDAVSATVSVGSGPVGIAVNPNTNKIYVANGWSNNVSVIDGNTNMVVATIPVGNIDGGTQGIVSVNSNTNKIYVANEYSDNVSVIDGDTNEVVKTISVGKWPDGIAVNPNANKIYVANVVEGSISVLGYK